MDCEHNGQSEENFMEQLYAAARQKEIPLKGVFELTVGCNFNCNMCYVHLMPDQIAAQGRELSAEQWIALGRAARDAGMLELTLTGGEPLTRPDFRRIYEGLSELGLRIQIFTNGYLIDEEFAEWLAKRPPHAVRITLYGASDETYEKVCGIREGFSRVARAVELLVRARIPLYLVSTVTRENEQDLGKMYAMAQNYHLPMTHTFSLVNPVRGASADPKAHQIEIGLPPEEMMEELRRKNRRYPRAAGRDFLDACGNYRTAFWITWSGKMQMCAFLSEPSVPVTQETFLQAWKELLDQVRLLRQPGECENCKYEPYCDRCPGVLYADSGSCSCISAEVCARARRNYQIYHVMEEKDESAVNYHSGI